MHTEVLNIHQLLLLLHQQQALLQLLSTCVGGTEQEVAKKGNML
jgi:hypothetical protein